jgi:hypothetical protein
VLEEPLDLAHVPADGLGDLLVEYPSCFSSRIRLCSSVSGRKRRSLASSAWAIWLGVGSEEASSAGPPPRPPPHPLLALDVVLQGMTAAVLVHHLPLGGPGQERQQASIVGKSN